ncbi:hypothetical protein NLX71_13930 [Paenibacillus sp. MZ04-78.2]|uniref:DUF6843 domain-containing protein n=1 Tax=Paenibacillus sp. MZ04-78.2 TaxID=2962034 RepID=UPI0020B6DCAD|nr:hypothetical protein [Paenibacillus sp. MZ04-78.2]MCP3774398.1 hypothetical protein [Paenibacillus sp. MZ04-78.2]
MLKKLYVLYLVVFFAISIAAVVIGSSPPLLREGKEYVHLIPRTGILNTSDSPTSGGMKFYYLDEKGNRNKIELDMIRGQGMGTKNILTSKGTTEQLSVNVFFVGTEQQWKDEKNRN